MISLKKRYEDYVRVYYIYIGDPGHMSICMSYNEIGFHSRIDGVILCHYTHLSSTYRLFLSFIIFYFSIIGSDPQSLWQFCLHSR